MNLVLIGDVMLVSVLPDHDCSFSCVCVCVVVKVLECFFVCSLK